jgi:glycosyltransferase involved in cell wall biosynthesis
MNDKLPISAIVVGYNEGHLLSSCLKGIEFCSEILYFDLGSTDNSLEIARKKKAKLIKHDKVPIVEIIHSQYFKKTENKWILITDPDEVISDALKWEIEELFKNEIPSDVGAVIAPWVFFFKKHRLRGTSWGGINSRVLLVHNERFIFTSSVHSGRQLKEGYKYKNIELQENNFIYHYWMQSYKMLFEKHNRYLRHEGEARFNLGQRTSMKSIITSPFKFVIECYIYKKGYRDGLVGFFLSIFWSWYQTNALIELYKYTNRKK